MSKIAVVINHWGGVPVTLQGNLAESQTWADTQGILQTLELPNLNPTLSFRNIAATSGEGVDSACLDAQQPIPLPLFDALHRTGVQIIVLGATGLRGDPSKSKQSNPTTIRHEDSLPDPREDLHAWGIDRCSMHDPAHSCTTAILHDEEVLLEARRILAENIQEPTLIWVNLLSCRDVNHCRFRPCTGVATMPSYSSTPLPTTDERIVPRNLRVPLDSLSHIAACADAGVFGETSPSPEALFLEAGQYLRLLEEARDTLLRIDTWSKMLVQDAEDIGAAIAMTATHALPLGEHGARTVGLPTDMCCRTFWCSTVPYSETTAHCLSAAVDDFIHQVFGVAPRRARQSPCTLGLLSHGPVSVVVARVTYRWNDRKYACIATWTPNGQTVSLLPLSLTHVFDLDMDPEETINILPQLAHIYTQLLEFMESCVPKSVVLAKASSTSSRSMTSAPSTHGLSASGFTSSNASAASTFRPIHLAGFPNSTLPTLGLPTSISSVSSRAASPTPSLTPSLAPSIASSIAPSIAPSVASTFLSSVPATSDLPTPPLTLLSNANITANLYRASRHRVSSSRNPTPVSGVRAVSPGHIRRKESTLHNRHR